MATMIDVARLAGVSHGTVSNVLSGAKGVRIEKIRAVEDAIKQLGYKPNALARNLKMNNANRSIAIILPDISEGAYRDMFDSISRSAELKGYNVNLHLTNELNYREKQALGNAQMYNIDGAIIVTCQPENKEYFDKLAKDNFNMVFLYREVEGADFVGMNVKDSLIKHISEQLKNGVKRVALITGPKEYSFETQCFEAYIKALFDANIEIRNQLIKITNLSKESAMRAAIKFLNYEERPEIIYITSEVLAEGARKAIELTVLPGEKKPKLVIIGKPMWTRIINQDEEDFVLPYAKMGEKALHILIEKIEGKEKTELKKILVLGDNSDKPGIDLSLTEPKKDRRRISILLQEGQMGAAVKALSNDFIKRTGIELTIDLINYKDLLDAIYDSTNTGKYDAFCIDVPWTKELAIGQHIQNLEPFIKNKELLVDAFQKNIFREYCTYEGGIYSLPYSYTVQMLYYRKDLFEKIKNKRMYHDMYKEELKVPKTWKEFNKVARFFTREFNPDSETLYGTTLGGKRNSGAVCEFLPRAWAFGGSSFEGRRVTINNHRSLQALKNYVECYNYAPPGSQDWWWDDEANEFCSGNTAMMVLFSDHATVLRDQNTSAVVGKTGHGFIPGEISMLGGWTIAMSSASKCKEEAFEFLKWTVLEELAMPNAALGRILPYKSICENTELANFYPWHKDSFRVFGNVGKRVLPNSGSTKPISEADYEKIIAEAVYCAITKKWSPEDALAWAHQQLIGLLGLDAAD